MDLNFFIKISIFLAINSVINCNDFNLIGGHADLKLGANIFSDWFNNVNTISNNDNCKNHSIFKLPRLDKWIKSWICSNNNENVFVRIFKWLVAVPLLFKHHSRNETPVNTTGCTNPAGIADLYISYASKDQPNGKIIQYYLNKDDGPAPIFKRGEDFSTSSAKTSNHLLLSSSGKRLYSIELNNIVVYSDDLCTGKLSQVSSTKKEKVYMATLSPDEQYLLAPGENVLSFKIEDDGSLKLADSVKLEFENKVYFPFSMTFYPKGKNILAVSYLLIDQVRFFELNAVDGKLKLLSIIANVAKDAKPDQIQFYGQYMYVLGVKSKTVTPFKILETSGTISGVTPILSKYAIKPDKTPDYTDYFAKMIVHPKRNFLYTLVSNHNYISVFKIGKDGTLADPVFLPLDKQGYGMAITPDGKRLLIGHDKINVVVIYSINQADGTIDKKAVIPDIKDVGYILTASKKIK